MAESRDELLELAWGLIANAGWDAGSGRVDLPKTTGWHEAAIRWRDAYFRLHEPGPSEEDKIREAMRLAEENPGRTVTVE